MVRVVLTKTKRDAANCWTSHPESEYAADSWVQDQMQRKLTLERFQKENPGLDFSGAEISGNYTKGDQISQTLRNNCWGVFCLVVFVFFATFCGSLQMLPT
jgi:hypothetical protein